MKNFYFVTILSLVALLITSLVYMGSADAQAKKAKNDSIQFSDTPCGRAMLPIVAQVVGAAMTAADEHKAKQIGEPWAALLVAGEVALIEKFKEANGAVIPGPYAWRQVSVMIGFVLDHTAEYKPEGTSPAKFIEAIGAMARAAKMCATENTVAPVKPKQKNPSVSL